MTLLVVAAALIDRRGRVLVQQRSDSAAHAGLWEFPGGKVEAGERLTMALARELAEELAISVEPGDCRPVAFSTAAVADEADLLLMLFHCAVWVGEPVAHSAQALAWVGRDALLALPMPPADVPLAQALLPLLSD